MARAEPSLALRGRISDLAVRYGLPDEAVGRLSTLLALVVADPLAPTSVREPERVLDDHLADSLVALELDQTRTVSMIVDLGAGAGFPGIPLALALPGAGISLVESSSRKCAFIERAIAACEVGNARTVHARAESWPDGIGRADMVTARALGPLEVVAEYAAPLLSVGGTLVIWRGRRDPSVEAAAEAAAEELGLEVSEVRAVTPYRGAEHRHLYLMSKVRETPSGFPRRPGMARKRPLGSGSPAV